MPSSLLRATVLYACLRNRKRGSMHSRSHPKPSLSLTVRTPPKVKRTGGLCALSRHCDTVCIAVRKVSESGVRQQQREEVVVTRGSSSIGERRLGCSVPRTWPDHRVKLHKPAIRYSGLVASVSESAACASHSPTARLPALSTQIRNVQLVSPSSSRQAQVTVLPLINWLHLSAYDCFTPSNSTQITILRLLCTSSILDEYSTHACSLQAARHLLGYPAEA